MKFQTLKVNHRSAILNHLDMSKYKSKVVNSIYRVYMRCVTWSRDSHGLFDYESRYITKRNIKTYTGGKIIRTDNNVEFISKSSSATEFGPNAKPLIIVHEHKGEVVTLSHY